MRLLIFAFVAALALFFGCVSIVEPQGCAGLSENGRARCLYKEAVLSQEPYNCYFIGDLALRGACMKDATDPKARQNFTQVAQPQPEPVQLEPEEKPPAPPQDETVVPAEERLCASYAGDAADGCYRDLAFRSKDIAYCKKVFGMDMRSSCISTVAFAVKNPAICTAFDEERDVSLCNFYSKGGAESG
jgi:hypothetical protein